MRVKRGIQYLFPLIFHREQLWEVAFFANGGNIHSRLGKYRIKSVHANSMVICLLFFPLKKPNFGLSGKFFALENLRAHLEKILLIFEVKLFLSSNTLEKLKEIEWPKNLPFWYNRGF